MTIHLVSTIDEVLRLALTEKAGASPSPTPELQTTH
jgi:hypothetical protein